jgi:uncharacterized membrane protein
VVEIIEDRLESTPRGEVRQERIAVEVGGEEVIIERTRALQDVGGIEVKPGDRVLLAVSSTPSGDFYYIADYVRAFPLWALTVCFILLVVIVGRASGAWSLVGMLASLLVIIRFIIPGILSGYSPVLIALIGALIILATTLYLTHGFGRKTNIAIAGIGVSLALTAALSLFCIEAFRLSGLADEDATTLQILSAGSINPEGLLLAGIIIGALGVLDDVAIAQASAVQELRLANPLLGAHELYSRAMNVGRDHIGSTVNTLLLAYAGASLPLLLILSTQTESLGNLLNREFMAVEIVRTLVGSIGIIVAVPITTALAAYLEQQATSNKQQGREPN